MKLDLNKFLIIALSICLLVWLSADACLRYLNKKYPKEEIEGRFEPIVSKYGIKIVYEIGDDFFSSLVSPLVVTGPDSKSKVKPIRHRVLLKYPELLEKAFDKYPVYIVKRYLQGINFAREIIEAGSYYGGSYDQHRQIVYIVDHGFTGKNYGLYVFHHEFASLLLSSHPLSVDLWTEQHSKEFKYLNKIYDSFKQIDKAQNKFKDDESYEKGIVTSYGLTCLENDFCEYSAMIFTYPQKFKKIMNQHPRVRAKFLVWLEFYQKIDPIFTDAYLLGDNQG